MIVLALCCVRAARIVWFEYLPLLQWAPWPVLVGGGRLLLAEGSLLCCVRLEGCTVYTCIYTWKNITHVYAYMHLACCIVACLLNESNTSRNSQSLIWGRVVILPLMIFITPRNFHYLGMVFTHNSHFSCFVIILLQAIGYGLVLMDGNVVNINKLKKLNLVRIDRLFRVS